MPESLAEHSLFDMVDVPLPSSRQSSIPRQLEARPTFSSGDVCRTPAVYIGRAVSSCSGAAHAPGDRARRVSGSAGPGVPLEGGRGKRKGKAIKLDRGYRRPRWWRPPMPRARPHRRSKRRVKRAVEAAQRTGEQVQASTGAEADIVISVLQESLRKAILRAEQAEAKLAQAAESIARRCISPVLLPHHKSYTNSSYSSPAAKRSARLQRRAQRRAALKLKESSSATPTAPEPQQPRPAAPVQQQYPMGDPTRSLQQERRRHEVAQQKIQWQQICEQDPFYRCNFNCPVVEYQEPIQITWWDIFWALPQICLAMAAEIDIRSVPQIVLAIAAEINDSDAADLFWTVLGVVILLFCVSELIRIILAGSPFQH